MFLVKQNYSYKEENKANNKIDLCEHILVTNADHYDSVNFVCNFDLYQLTL